MAKPLPVAAVVLPRESRRRSAPGRSPAGRSSPQCHRRYLHGAVGVRSQGDAQGGQHTHAAMPMPYRPWLKAAVKAPASSTDLHAAAGGEVADQHRSRHDQDGGQSGLQTQGDAADDDGGGAGLRASASCWVGL